MKQPERIFKSEQLIKARCVVPFSTLLDEALARKHACVSEVSESGSVPELLFVNDAEDRALLIDGEELVGARQNRILNVSIVVGGRQKVVIPVSCVEQGRWSYKKRHFESGERTLFASARAKKTQHVSASMRASGSRYANQAGIWSRNHASARYRPYQCVSRGLHVCAGKRRDTQASPRH